MPAVERMFQYSQLEQEKAVDDVNRAVNHRPKADANSGLRVENLVMKYRPELPPALRGLNIDIKAGEHVAIVGRTGSGKSSFGITLFRLYQPETDYNVQLNDEQLSHMPLFEARRRLAIIPQEPYLFSGTLRQQLCEYSRNRAEGLGVEGLVPVPDEEIWKLLEIVQLKDYISALPGGIDCQIVGNGDNFSIGQRQLICCIRAFIRNCEIIILDEATAFIDKETDAIIQRLVHTFLRDKIVLSIAHRLESVLDMDKVMVMDAGVCTEFGTQLELMEQQGIFYQLVVQANMVE